MILLRSIIATFILVLWTAFTATLVIICGRRKITDYFVANWGRFAFFLFNIKLEVLGMENLPPEGVLFVFNHSSHWDILTFCAATATTHKYARFGAKIELFNIPIFGQGMKAYGVLPIHRADRERVLELYQTSIARVHSGESFVLAAEGTRQPVPGVGPRFKSGPFIFAISGQFPILPFVIKGAAEIMPKGKWLPCTKSWSSTISIQFLRPFPTKGLTLDNREALQEEVRLLMTKAYESQ